MKRTAYSQRGAASADVEIGQRVRLRGMSQRDGGRVLGVTYQQFHKYEIGKNRFSAAALKVLAIELGTTPEALLGVTQRSSDVETLISANDKKVLRLLRAYYQLPTRDMQIAFVEFFEKVAG